MKFKTGELAKLLNVSSNTIRRYEDMGYINPERIAQSNYRVYDSIDFDKLMWIRMYRKYGMAHEDIAQMDNTSVKSIVQTFEERKSILESHIEYLNGIKSRLNGNIKMIKKIENFKSYNEIKNCNYMNYILYRRNNDMLKEPERLKIFHKFLYELTEINLIYIFPIEDILSGNISYGMGIATKQKDLTEHGIKQDNAFVKNYPKRDCFFYILRINGDLDNYFEKNPYNTQETLFANAFNYFDKNNLSINGDALGLKLAMLFENGEDVQYILMCIPIKTAL